MLSLGGATLNNASSTSTMPAPRCRQVTYRRERWDTPDGDFIDVDFLDTPFPGGSEAAGCDGDDTPFAVLTHGLESTSTAPLTARMALA